VTDHSDPSVLHSYDDQGSHRPTVSIQTSFIGLTAGAGKAAYSRPSEWCVVWPKSFGSKLGARAPEKWPNARFRISHSNEQPTKLELQRDHPVYRAYQRIGT
jgi:hypothetical protein